MKKCFRCKRIIEKKEDYYRFTEFKEGKEVKTDYAHRKCWDEFLKQIGSVDKAMGMLRGLKDNLIKRGMLKQEEFIIK